MATGFSDQVQLGRMARFSIELVVDAPQLYLITETVAMSLPPA